MIKRIGFVLLSIFTLTNCQPKQVITATDEKPMVKNVNLNSELIKAVNQTYSKDSTLTFNSKVGFTKDGKSQPKVSLSLKMRHQEIVWGSASFLFPIGRAIITPSGIKGYAKFPEKVFFDSDFALIEKKIGLKGLNYSQIEALLTGRPLFSLNETDYTVTKTPAGGYVFTLKKNETLLKQKSATEVTQVIELNSAYNVVKQAFIKSSENTTVSISYQNFTTIGKQNYPLLMEIATADGTHPIQISIEHKSIEANLPLQIPFELPKEADGYKKIKL